MMKFANFLPGAAAALALAAASAQGQTVLFSAALDSADDAIDWKVNKVNEFDRATFGFDYGAIGIPPAPNSTDGTTIGLMLQANVPREGSGNNVGLLSGLSVSPLDQAFEGNYQLRFDLWQNFPGPFPDGGAGSTQVSGGGILSSGNVTHYVAGGYSAITMFVTGDGGTTEDYRVYAAANVTPSLASTTYAAASPGETSYRNSSDSYYASFGGVQAPAAHTKAFPIQTGTTAAGSQGMEWHDVAITKIGSIITWHIDDVLIATTDLSLVTGARSGSNIYLAQSDINATTSYDAGSGTDLSNLLFGLFDNVRVIALPDVLTVSATRTDSNTPSEGNSQVASFEVARTGATDAALTVNFTVDGAATRGVAAGAGDYFLRVNGAALADNAVVIPAGAASVVVEVAPVDDNESEPGESLGFALADGEYTLGTPRGGSVSIADNDAQVIDITTFDFTQAFEGNAFDRARLTLTRLGNLEAAAYDVNLTYAGTAIAGTDYTPITAVTFEPGQVTKTVDLFPISDTLVEETETIDVSIAAGPGYTTGTNPLTPGVTATIVNDDLGPEEVLWADTFLTSTIEDYIVRFGSTVPDSNDYRAEVGFDYSLNLGIPQAPNTADPNDTFGLFVTANKNTAPPATAGKAAGVNVYPRDKTFSGNYALRFDMYLLQNTGASTTENAIFGLNHTTENANWFARSGAGVPAGTTYDGIVASVQADASNELPGDYTLFTGPAVLAGTVNGPTYLTTRASSTLRDVFHNPPWTPGGGAGSPGNIFASETKSWAQVELSQVDGVITLKINNTEIFSRENTGANSGDVMFGYVDAFDSVPGTLSARVGSAIYDNVRVVRLANVTPSEINITGTSLSGGNLVINFTSTGGEPASAFKLFSSTTIDGTFAEDNTAGNTITATANGYQATTPVSGASRFFLIRKTP